MAAPISITWPGGEHAFRLGIGQLDALQSVTGQGPEELLLNLRAGRWSQAHLESVIRLGLIGGGMADVAAKQVTRATFDRGFGLMHYKPACMMVMEAALFGPEDDPVGKSQAPAAEIKVELPPESGVSPSDTASG